MKINRRSFLKRTLAAGSLAVGTGSLLSACSSSRRADLPDQDLSKPINGQLDPNGGAILYHASLAPSGHNAQPWFVRIVKKNEWIIGLDPQRRLPEVDPDNREALLSIGAFAENLALAAGTYGFQAEMEIIAENRFQQDIIKVSLEPTRPSDYPLERLSGRMTVKQGYLADEIKNEDIQALSEPLKGRLFYFPKGTEQGGGWLVITSEGQTVTDLIDCGRRFERMALMAKERKLAIQPMTQYLEEKEGQDQIAADHTASIIPQFILRAGYLKNYPNPASLRRPVNWFVRS